MHINNTTKRIRLYASYLRFKAARLCISRLVILAHIFHHSNQNKRRGNLTVSYTFQLLSATTIPHHALNFSMRLKSLFTLLGFNISPAILCERRAKLLFYFFGSHFRMRCECNFRKILPFVFLVRNPNRKKWNFSNRLRQIKRSSFQTACNTFRGLRLRTPPSETEIRTTFNTCLIQVRTKPL
jgi:hypothetical protein